MKILLKILLFPLVKGILVYAGEVYAHGSDGVGSHPLNWNTKQIAGVFSSSPYSAKNNDPRIEEISGRSCMTGPFLNIDVDNDYAFNIDETVHVEIEFDLDTTTSQLLFNYDKNGGIAGSQRVTLPDKMSSRWYRHTFVLERARFAERFIRGLNPGGDFSIAGARSLRTDLVTICSIVITRSYKTLQSNDFGDLDLSIIDAEGNRSPARIGIYDATGRMTLPGKEAVPIKYNESLVSRSIVIPSNVSWPADNRYGFYIDGRYRTKLPVGKYEIVISRGLEYRIIQDSFDIKLDRKTQISKKLLRWTNMPAMGWYSGDVHIHYSRANTQDDHNIQLQMQAEDIHVASLLQMDDIGTVGFQQYNWGTDVYANKAPYNLVPGQEGPRSHRGHAIHLNINQPSHDPPRYYLYHEVFKSMRQKGGITGYAHVRPAHDFGARFGLALDVPYGLVDFVEIFQFGQLDLEIWFDFLNLGYKLSPAAGSDFVPLAPMNIPGNVRSYVNVGIKYSVQGWFDGLKAGQTFVTNGPMLDLKVNGTGMGQELEVSKGEKINIAAKALLNPDIGLLDKIELYQQGELVVSVSSAQGASELELNHDLQANNGSWFVIKALGKQINQSMIVAASAPVYINVNGSGFCKPSAVSSIVRELKSHMKNSLSSAVSKLGYPHSRALRVKYWPENAVVLEARMNNTFKRYDNLVLLAEKGSCTGG